VGGEAEEEAEEEETIDLEKGSALSPEKTKKKARKRRTNEVRDLA
jgi:hypothetical protein